MTDQSSDQSPPDADAAAPPGWYPDPLAAATLRYWDGKGWTNHISGATAKARPERDRARTIIALGGLALGISPFLTWVDVALLGSLNLFQLTDAVGRSSGLAWGAISVGCLSALGAWTADSHRRARTIGVTAGLLAGMAAVAVLLNMADEIRGTAGLVRISYGPLVAIGGCLAMIVGGLLSRPAPSEAPLSP